MHLFLLVALSTGAGFPELLTKPLPGSVTKDKTWTWPQREDFDEAWRKRLQEKQSYTLLTGVLDAVSDTTQWERIDTAVAQYRCRAPSVTFREVGSRLIPLMEGNDWCAGQTWEVVKTDEATLMVTSGNALGRFVVRTKQLARPVPEPYLTDWTYAATLLSPMPAGEKLLKEYEQNVPMGQCSMDRAPADFTRVSAERCYQAGELACFLQLQLRVMADQFNRVAWSSMGEAASPTYTGRLESTGIDVDRFLRGLVLVLPGDRPSEIGSSRLARALIESGRREKFEPLLVAMIEDPALDTFNRFRAFTTWVSLHYRGGDSGALDAKVGKLKLEPMSKTWWSTLKR